MKVILDRDSVLVYYKATFELNGVEVEVEEEFLERCKKCEEEFWEVQNILCDLYKNGKKHKAASK